MKKKITYKLEDQVGYLLRRANQRHTSIFFDELGQQLTPMQFAVLVKIGDEGEVSQNRLGRMTAMDPATVQGVVRRLSDRQLIDARPDPEDRRKSLWQLSERGSNFIIKAIPEAITISEQTLEPLSQIDQQTFLELLRKLT